MNQKPKYLTINDPDDHQVESQYLLSNAGAKLQYLRTPITSPIRNMIFCDKPPKSVRAIAQT